MKLQSVSLIDWNRNKWLKLGSSGHIPQADHLGWSQWSVASVEHQSIGHPWGAEAHWPCRLGRVGWCHQHQCVLSDPWSALAVGMEGSCWPWCQSLAPETHKRPSSGTLSLAQDSHTASLEAAQPVSPSVRWIPSSPSCYIIHKIHRLHTKKYTVNWKTSRVYNCDL